MGITDVAFIQADGTWAIGAGKITNDEFLAPHIEPVLTAAGK
jgi:hypothetical protein